MPRGSSYRRKLAREGLQDALWSARSAHLGSDLVETHPELHQAFARLERAAREFLDATKDPRSKRD